MNPMHPPDALRPCAMNAAALDIASDLPGFPVDPAPMYGASPTTPRWARDVLDWYSIARATGPDDMTKTIAMIRRSIDRLRDDRDLQDALLAVKALAPPGESQGPVGAWLAALARAEGPTP